MNDTSPQIDPNDPEPFPWLRDSSRGGPVLTLPGLRYPLGSLIYGAVHLALAVWAVVYGLGLNGQERATLLLIALLPAGLGALMIYVGARRWGWYYRYVARHGYSPFGIGGKKPRKKRPDR